ARDREGPVQRLQPRRPAGPEGGPAVPRRGARAGRLEASGGPRGGFPGPTVRLRGVRALAERGAMMDSRGGPRRMPDAVAPAIPAGAARADAPFWAGEPDARAFEAAHDERLARARAAIAAVRG